MAKGKIQSSITTLENENLVTASPVAQTANKRQGKHSTKSLGLMAGSLLLCALVSVAHYRVASIGDEYTGILAPIDRLFDVLFTALMIGSMFCVGRSLSRHLTLTFANLAEEIAFSILLGTGTIGLCVLGLGFAHLFNPWLIFALYAVLLALAHREIVRLYQLAGELLGKISRTRENIIFSLLLIGLFGLLACRAAAPPYMADDAICHLAVPKLFIQAGGFIPLYDNFASHMPLLNHMHYVVCLLAKSDIAARLFNLSLAITTAILIYGFCARFLSRAAAKLAMFGFFGAGVIMEVAITNRIDVTVSGMLFGATYAMILYFDENKKNWLWTSALLSGFSLSIKYTAAAWIAMLGVMFVYESLRKREKVTSLAMRGVMFTLIMLAVVSPWLIKNCVYFKNPVYPFGTGEVADYNASGVRYFTLQDEEKMEAFFEQSRRELPGNVAEIEEQMALEAAKRIERHPLRVWELFTDSDLYNMGDEFNQGPNYLFIVIPILLFLPKKKWLVWLSINSVVFFLFVASSSWIARYLVPLYPGLTILAVYVLTTISERFRKQAPLARLLPQIAVVTAILSTSFVFAVQIYKAGNISFLMGELSRREFLQAVFYYPALDYVNHNTPKEASVLLMGVQTSYHLERNYLADAAWDSVQWQRLMVRNNSLEEINQDLKKQGVRYVIFSPGLYRFIARLGREGSGPAGTVYSSPYAAGGTPDYRVQLRNWATFELYRSKFLRLKYQVRDYYIFEIM